MEAQQLEVWKLLGTDYQYSIPIYQRRYNWGKKQCARLYNDVVKIGNSFDRTSHFIGAITYVSDAVPAHADVIPYQIIDGQQRLTTLMLLLMALKNSITDTNTQNVTKKKIEQLLFNITAQPKSPYYYKLVLTDNDDVSFKRILNDEKTEESNNITANFRFFEKELVNNKIDPDIIWKGIRRLTTVSIHIKKDGGDEPQEIFESMNSTGMGLSNTDLVRNYILMRYDRNIQKEIYEKYWKKMENNINNEGNLDEFLRNYLMMEKGIFISKNNIYDSFKEYAHDKNMDDLLHRIYVCSEQYKTLIFKCHESEKLNKVIGYILDQDTTIAHSLLLKVLVDHKNNKISTQDACNIFLLIDCYLLRCVICDTGIKASNRMFSELIPNIKNEEYVKSIECILMLKTAPNLRFPRNELFKEKFIDAKIYSNKSICKYILVRLEHHNNNEIVDSANLQIEHIMPQTINNEWQKYLGPSYKYIHEKFLHTIGNLTLTAHNSEISNSIFNVKKNEYSKSHLKITKDLCNYTQWRENEITLHANALADIALQIWKIPAEPKEKSILDDDDMLEKEYLDGKEIKELWHKLKDTILSSCKHARFNMTKRYGSIKTSNKNNKVTNVCIMLARKNKIYLIYNTKINDTVIKPSKFIEDISRTNHHYRGDFQSIIINDDDVDRSIPSVVQLYRDKSN